MTDLIAQAEAALDGVTDGPWVVRLTKDENFDVVQPDGLCVVEVLNCDQSSRPDATFIAWCREGVPALLARIAAQSGSGGRCAAPRG